MAEGTTVAVLGTRYPDFSVEEAVLGPRGVQVVPGHGATSSDVVSEARGAAVVLAGSRPRFDAWVIERLACVGIVRYGAGVETIDLEAAARAGKWVAYVPDYGTDAVASHTVALMLAALRRLLAADRIVRSGGWGIDELRPLDEPGSLRVGIIGAGRIGRRVAELLLPFGFELVVHDSEVDVAAIMPEVKSTSLPELLAESDVVTLHVPGSPGGRPLLGAQELDLLKHGAIVVNTARGSLIDQNALVERLRRGSIALAALDVYESEPPGDDLAGLLDKTILTPHMAWYTEQSESDLRSKAAHEALRLLDGLPPLNAAASPRGVR